MPSKRERGKQRKAVKILAAGSGNHSITQIVAKVRKGDNDATLLLADRSLEESNGILYEQSGILSTILRFLKRCEDDTFVKVMLDVGGGDMRTPKLWVGVLTNAEVQEPSCRLHIAQNISPLVRCMCNDTTRLFFKSNEHWVNTIHPFVCLIHNMILHSADNSDKPEGKEIIDTLLQYEGLLTSIVQWGFWGEECRPDITNEPFDCTDIVRLGNATLIRLVLSADTKVEAGRERLEIIGTTPMISKEYDPECTISFVVGLIRQLKIEGWTMDASEALRRLTIWGSCVDKDVITELIDMGFNTRDDKWIAHIAACLRFMILKEHTYKTCFANETRVAFAIRGGLIELCLAFIERFGLNESFDKERDSLESLFVSIQSILSNIYWIRLHKKTGKAIRSKRCRIEQELARLEKNDEITNNVSCKKLLDMSSSMLDINGSYCCRCNKVLSKTEVKLCNGCGSMTYCSSACQKEDWSIGGHKLACCSSPTMENIGQFQGRFHPSSIPVDERAAAKLKEIEINVNMIQLKTLPRSQGNYS